MLNVYKLELNNTIIHSGHTAFVNSCYPSRRGPQLVVSGADDCTIKIWDPRKKGQAVTLNNTYQVTSVTFNDTSEQVITGGIDNDIKVPATGNCQLFHNFYWPYRRFE